MPDCLNINTAEKDKFTTDSNGDTCVRMCGSVAIIGSRAISGDFAEVTIDDSSWTDLTTSFTDILQLSVQNKTGVEIKVRPTPTAVAPSAGYVGMVLEDDEERNYNDLTSTFKVWGRASPGSGSVDVFVEVLRNA